MKRNLFTTKAALLVCALLFILTGIGRAQMTMSESATAPVPGPYDISQLQFQTAGNVQPSGGSPVGFNYYWDASTTSPGKPGSTFTTGSNPGGYVLNSVTVLTIPVGAGGTYQSAATYSIRIYSVNSATTNATLIVNNATAANSYAFVTAGDWLTGSGLSVPLLPNTTYAYTFQGSQGYCELNYSNGLATVGSDLGMRLCQVPTAGGRVVISTSANAPAAAFDVGLSLPSALTVAPPTASAANPVNQGTTIILTAGTVVDNVGNGTYTYQWQTDGGSGNTPTNIPGATATTLAFNTTGVGLGNYQYQLVVTDSTSQSVTTPVLVVNVIVREAGTFGTTPASIPPTPGGSDAFQLVDEGNGNGTGSHLQGNLNYYSDNGQNSGGWMGGTFTTGGNAKGYYLTSVAVCLDGLGGVDGVPNYGYASSMATVTNGTYNVYIFKLSADLTTCQTIALITNWNGGFVISNYPVWFQTSFAQIALASNSVYGYGFGRGSVNVGYGNIALSPGGQDYYTGGTAASFPTAGGAVTYINNGLDGVFDIGLIPLGAPFLLGAAIATPNPAYALSPVKLACKPISPGNFTYQWLTDDGTGATPPNYITIPGATATNATVIPQNINPGGADYPTNYYFVATDGNSGLSVTSAVVTLTVHAASAPQFTATPTPTNLVTFVGDHHTYSVTEAGTLPITNLWLFDNGLGGGYVGLTGKTSTTLILTSLQTTNSGNYQIAATNLLGGTNTEAVTLTVRPAPTAPIVSQKYAYMAYTNNPWAYWRLNETNDPTVLDAPVYTAYDYSGHGFYPTYGNAVTVNNPGPVPSVSFPSFPGLDANELAAGTTVSTPNAYLTVPALNLAGKSNVTFIAWINPSGGGQSANAGLLFNRGGPDSACGFGFGATSDHLGYTWNNNAAATYNWDSGLVVAEGEWNFVAYVITPTNATVYLGNLSGGTTNFLQANNAIAHTGETFSGGTIRLGGDSSGVNRNFNGLICEATLFTNALTTLQIQQYFLASIGASALSPTISATTISPSSASVYSGQNVRLSANASGTEPLHFQWQSSPDSATWTDVPGATANTLLFNPFTVGTAYYRLMVTNVTASMANTPVAVTFNPLPSYPPGLWTANFQPTNNIGAGQNVGGGVGHYVGRGILGNGMYWNILPHVLLSGGGYTANSLISVSDLLDDGVTHSGIYCHMNSGGSYNSLGGSLPNSSDIGNLLDQFYRTYYSDAANGNGALQFFGVPAGTYNLVCYAGNGVTSQGANNYGSTFVVYDSVNGNQTNSTAEPTPVTDALSEGVNFVTFTHVHIAGGVLQVDVLGNVATGGSAIIQGAQIQLVSYDPPAATFIGIPTNGFAPLNVVFTNTTTTSVTNAVWTFGDGSSVTNTSGGLGINGIRSTNTYAAVGTYTVDLTVKGPGGTSSTTRTSYIVTSPKPAIGSVKLSGGGVALSGSNGPAGVQYRILTSTNLLLPLANWTPVWTNVFAADGSYSYTNSSPTNNDGFFILVSP